MGEESDRMIQRILDEDPRFGGKSKAEKKQARAEWLLRRKEAAMKAQLPIVSVLTKGEPITTEKLSAQHLSWQDPPRTLENMPDALKAELAAEKHEHRRAIKILQWLQDITQTEAINQYNAYNRKRRGEEAEAERHRECREKIEQLMAAETLEDLKPLLSEIIILLWSPK
jgi:hypothetical protein